LNKNHTQQPKKKKQKFHRQILQDIQDGQFKRTLGQDFKDIYYFYLDRETRKRLSSMSRFRRWFVVGYWLLRSLVQKLTPVRRVLLVLGLIFFFLIRISSSGNDIHVNINLQLLGFCIILALLMLELKDKLLAHDEMRAGRAVQFALIPKEPPQFKGWDIWFYSEPANEVGGDLVDYLGSDNGHLSIALGDVAGKGFGAALLMAKLQATLRALAPNYKSLSNLGEEVNRIFCRDGIPSRFVSLIYCILESGSGTIHLLNAGHLPPLVLHEKKIDEIAGDNPALGLLPLGRFREQKIHLNTGDIIFIYSDGVTEAQNGEEQFFGEDRLKVLLPELSSYPTKTIGKHLLNAMHDFTGDARQNDDLSFVILKRVG
jgi:hypothetical protein